MPLYDLPDDLNRLQQDLAAAPARLIVCYCAEWCDTCRSYRPALEALAAQWPDDRFLWVDIETHPELLGDEEVENFPTLLVQDAEGVNRFFGPLPPQPEHLARLLARQGAARAAVAGPPSLQTLLAG